MGQMLSILTLTGLTLPYASAQFGRRPLHNQRWRWSLSSRAQPLAGGRTLREMARAVYG